MGITLVTLFVGPMGFLLGTLLLIILVLLIARLVFALAWRFILIIALVLGLAWLWRALRSGPPPF